MATAHNVETLRDLKEKYGDAMLTMAHKTFGRLDVVVNNAGSGQFGAI